MTKGDKNYGTRTPGFRATRDIATVCIGGAPRPQPQPTGPRPQGSPGAVPRPSSALDGRAGALTAPEFGPGLGRRPWWVWPCMGGVRPAPARLGWVAAVHTPPGATGGHWGGMGRVSGRSRMPLAGCANGEIWGYPGNSPKSNFLVE